MSTLRILCCNDDGHAAPGLGHLVAVARTLSDDVWTVGPERKWTAASHHVTFDRDLTLTAVGERRYACSGTPVDGVVAALSILLADHRPDLVLAGINDKRNVAEDIAYSGTMAIAREATFWGIPAIAVSGEGWESRSAGGTAALARLVTALWASRDEWACDGSWLSVNLPASLPAPVARASIGSDKIAEACDVVSRDADRIVFRLRRGRSGRQRAGDENSLIAHGCVSIVRWRWQSDAELSDALVARWQVALDDAAS